MAETDRSFLVKNLVNALGGAKNILNVSNCLTRLRITVIDESLVNDDLIKKNVKVLGIKKLGKQIQIIFGPKIVIQIHKSVSDYLASNSSSAPSLEVIAKANKKEFGKKNTNWLQQFLAKFSTIFSPLIIGFIGAGVLSGIAGIIQSAAGKDFATNATAQSWYKIFSVLLDIWKSTFLIVVGWRTAKAFGGSGVIGAIIAGLYVSAFAANSHGMFIAIKNNGIITGYNFLGLKIGIHHWFLQGFRPSATGVLSYPSGSIFGVLLSAGIVGFLEKTFRKVIPGALDAVLTPTFTLIVLLILNLVFLFPVSGYLFSAVAFMFTNLYANPFGAALLAGLFLPTVVLGIHQGFVPVYSTLVASENVNALFPILAMAGGGQVGMAIALYLRAEKKGVLRSQIQGAIIPGILGIGEPLIYGVSLPRIKPFITACLGGAVGGFVIGAYNLWGGDVMGLNTIFGPSGLLGVGLMTTKAAIIWKGIVIYLVGLLFSYLAGFLFTYYFGYKKVDLK